MSLTNSKINSLSLSASSSCRVLTGGPLIRVSGKFLSAPGIGKKVGVPSIVVDTIGRKKNPLLSNSCADIFLTGVVDPELSVLAEELEVPKIVECTVATIVQIIGKKLKKQKIYMKKQSTKSTNSYVN
jgi:hypothetical protein